jgi:hypothetical protein
MPKLSEFTLFVLTATAQSAAAAAAANPAGAAGKSKAATPAILGGQQPNIIFNP